MRDEELKSKSREMSYIKPHLSPELRAQITPQNKRDRKMAAAGVFLLLASAVLAYNAWPRPDLTSEINNKLESIGAQTKDYGTGAQIRQVLGDSTTALDSEVEQPAQATSLAQSQPAGSESPSDGDFTLYTVKNGDTLFNISQSYGVKWDLIAQFNSLEEPYLLHPGQTIKVPQATTSQIPDKIYTIQKGDTLVSIAKKYNITVDDIIAVNPNLQKSDLISIGQVIKLP